MIEMAYCNVKDRGFKTDDSCIHCGDGCREDRNSALLLRQEELQNKNMTDGYACFPVCAACLKDGKKVVRYPKKNRDLLQAKKEKDAKKAAAAAKKKNVYMSVPYIV